MDRDTNRWDFFQVRVSHNCITAPLVFHHCFEYYSWSNKYCFNIFFNIVIIYYWVDPDLRITTFENLKRGLSDWDIRISRSSDCRWTFSCGFRFGVRLVPHRGGLPSGFINQTDCLEALSKAAPHRRRQGGRAKQQLVGIVQRLWTWYHLFNTLARRHSRSRLSVLHRYCASRNRRSRHDLTGVVDLFYKPRLFTVCSCILRAAFWGVAGQ